MSGQDSNQLEARITSQLECPVCFNIPRDLPISCCPSGHIVCRPCKQRVRDCPTCRQPMPANMTNSLAGALIDQVQHRCKFHDQGCDIKMMLKDQMTRVMSQLECPVCLNIPRELSIPSCPSGHIVCRPCKTRVRDCPTCCQPMPANNTNSVVGALIEQFQHKCKFHDQGCKVKL